MPLLAAYTRSRTLTGSSTNERAAHTKEARLLCFLVGFLGILYIALLPPLQAPDENRHLLRAVSVTQGEWLATPLSSVPAGFVDLCRTFAPQWSPPLLAQPQWAVFRDGGLWSGAGRGTRATVANPPGNVYSPAPYSASALALWAAGSLGASPLLSLYAARATNLLAFTVLLWFSMRLMPEGRYGLMGAALLPMTLHQAASVSADSVTLALSFLCVAYVLHLSFRDTANHIGWREAGTLATILVLLSLCKFLVLFGLLPVIVPRERFGSRLRKIACCTGWLLASLSAGLGWQQVNSPNIRLFAVYKQHGLDALPPADYWAVDETLMKIVRPASAYVDSSANARALMDHPFLIARSAARTIVRRRDYFLTSLTGYLGSLAIPLPLPIAISCALCLLGLGLLRSGHIGLQVWQRLLLLAIAGLSAYGVFAVLWINEGNQFLLDRLRTGQIVLIPLVQGRYFLPLVTMTLAAVGVFRKQGGRTLARGFLVVIVLANVVSLWLLWEAGFGPHVLGPIPPQST